MKKIKLTEEQFNRIIEESEYSTLNEADYANAIWQGIKQGAKNAWNNGLKTVGNGVMQGYNGAQAQYYQNQNSGIDLMGAVNTVRGDIGGINQSAKGMYANALKNKDPQGVSTALNNINQQTAKLSQDTQSAIQNVNAFIKNSEKAKKYTDRLNRNGQQTTGGNANQGNSGQTQQQNTAQTNTNTSKNGWTRDSEGNYVNQQTKEKLSPYDYHMMVTNNGTNFSPLKQYNNRRGRYNPMYQQENRLRRNQVVLSEQYLHNIVRESLRAIIDEASNQNIFTELIQRRNTFKIVADKFNEAITKYKGSEFTKKMNDDPVFNKFIRGNVWPFLQSLIAAIDRCVKAQNLNEGVKSWALNTLQDSRFRIPQFIRQGVNAADYYGNRMANWTKSKMTGNAENAQGTNLQSGNVQSVKLNVLMAQQYPRLKPYVDSYCKGFNDPTNNPLENFKNVCDSFYAWWTNVYNQQTKP